MRVVLDLETTSTVDLRRAGAHAYAEHPDTRVTVLCWAIDDQPVETWLSGPPPVSFAAAVKAGATIVAHNYGFEHVIYLRKLIPQGWPRINLAQWSCTMARSLVAGYPAGLENVGKALGLAIQKDHSARDLMLRFARPRSRNPLVWWHETDPVRFQKLVDYCKQDVLAERELDKHVPELSRRERVLFELDFLINQRGLGIDHALVMELAHLADIARDQLTDRIRVLTNGAVRTLNQVIQLRTWLRGQGVDMPDLRRATVQERLTDQTLSRSAREALQARLDASRSSTAKLVAISEAASGDGRVRGSFQYYGASRTGRWAGRRVQPQNLFRGVIKDVPAALRAIHAGASVEDLDLLFEASALGVIASCLRSTIMAQHRHLLSIADFSQIEARVLAWLAGQQDALRVFANPTQDIYVETAAAIGSLSRTLGKVLVLACGFGMGPDRFRQTAAGYGLSLDPDEAADAVRSWRTLNNNIVDLWWDLHRVVLRVTRRGPGASETCGWLEVIHKPGALLIKLPSQRHLVYRRPRVSIGDTGHDEFSYMGALGSTWTRLRAWPGRLTENVTQAVARDVMAEAMLGLQDLPLVATVHDELIAEVPEDDADPILGRMLTAMRLTPSWAPGLPVNAAGVVATRYHK